MAKRKDPKISQTQELFRKRASDVGEAGIKGYQRGGCTNAMQGMQFGSIESQILQIGCPSNVLKTESDGVRVQPQYLQLSKLKDLRRRQPRQVVSSQIDLYHFSVGSRNAVPDTNIRLGQPKVISIPLVSVQCDVQIHQNFSFAQLSVTARATIK
jgi:hypothetical protein